MGIITDELEVMTDVELENFLDTTITLTWREYDLSLERARQNGLQTGMEIGRINERARLQSERLKGNLQICHDITERLEAKIL